MTDREKRNWKLGILATLVTALILRVGAGAWESKVSRGEFDTHVQGEEARWQAQYQLTLDVLCELKPQDRRCK